MGDYRGRVADLLFVPVDISRPQAPRGSPGRRQPPSRRALVSLILDSGSGYCSLKPEVIRRLEPPLRRSVLVRTHLGEGSAGLYAARLTFPLGSLAPLSDILIAGLAMPADLAAYDGVIGRNVLRGWETLYSGPRQRLTVRDHRSLWGWLLS
jgi:hypothetical protein